MNRFVTVDIIIETDHGIPLVKRAYPPYKGFWALPGGIVEDNETVEEAAVREAREETGLEIDSPRLTGVYSRPGRDPRGRSITIVFAARARGGEPKPGSDAAALSFFLPDTIPSDLAFDHGHILKDYLSLADRTAKIKR